MTLRPPHESYTIGITNTAGDKSHRMYNEKEILEGIRSGRGVFWKREEGKRGCEEYHQVYGPYVIVMQVDHDKHHIIVITQMHAHIDYADDRDFRQVERVQDPRMDVCPFGSYPDAEAEADTDGDGGAAA